MDMHNFIMFLMLTLRDQRENEGDTHEVRT